MALVVAIFVATVTVLVTQTGANKPVTNLLTSDTSRVHDKQLQDLTEFHGSRMAGVKNEHDGEHASARFDRLYSELEYMSTMYREQMRNMQEQEDRIRYLEKKLEEFGRTTAIARTPYSAPATQISFMNPPRRQRFSEGHRWPAPTRMLSKVVEAEDE
jgi:hypothetical protein